MATIEEYIGSAENHLNHVKTMDSAEKDACINDLLQAMKLLIQENTELKTKVNKIDKYLNEHF